ncbi:uncharacterized protein LOC121731877 [Aricia agestis]|uniref:uncharacterized protein LOC121731877 n=1 Tax=Aricia agestis TaxID=91739 RepID=UPI001C2062A0|nr:uncharacterized protein LOC121731877 [Aricia agestis]
MEKSSTGPRLWLGRLNESLVSVELLNAMRPVLREWVDRDSGALSYRLTQVLTGHGCFGQYLARREQNTACHHCSDDRDTAQHTLLVCPAWIRQREALQATIRPDITLPAIVRAMLDSEHYWRAVEAFAEVVMSSKEEAERRREAEALDPQRRPRRRTRASQTWSRYPALAGELGATVWGCRRP